MSSMLSKREKALTSQVLSRAEFDVLSVIWRSEKESLLSSEIRDSLSGMEWSLPEVMTYLKRLEKKGYISCDRISRRNIYKYIKNEEDFISELLTDLLGIHSCTFKDILKIAIQSNIISQDDIADCKELLSKY